MKTKAITDCPCRFTLAPIGIFAVFLVVAGLVTAAPAFAQQVCMDDRWKLGDDGLPDTDDDNSQNLNCNAKEISTLGASSSNVTDGCAYAGDTATADVAISFNVNPTSRYDMGIYAATDGGDALSGSCFVGVAPTTPPFLNLDDPNDACGDVSSNGGVPTGSGNYELTLEQVTFVCLDNDGDGNVDLPVCYSSRQNDDAICDGADDVFPGAPSKCDCDTVSVVGIPVPKTIKVTKVVSGGSGSFDLLIDSTVEANDVGNGGMTGNVSVEAGSHTVSETNADGTSVDPILWGTAISCVETVGVCTGDQTTACVTDTLCGALNLGTCNLTPRAVASCGSPTSCTSLSVTTPDQQSAIECTITNTSLCVPTTEICDGLDNNCNGIIDEGGDALCDDSLACNGLETCEGTSGCQDGTPVVCGPPDGDAQCNISVCTEPNGECVTQTANENDPCTDGEACTSSDGTEGGGDTCQSGICVGTPIVCDETDVDGDGECNTSACDTADGFCKDEPDNIGGPCGDLTDDQCNNPDTCNAGGTCDDNFEPTTTECTDGDACTSTGGIEGGPDNCNGQGNDGAACVSDDIVCDETDVDGDGECNTSACDTADGFCKDEPDNIGGPCGDLTDDQCNNPDTCNAGGTCDDNFEPTTTECTDGDACTSTGGIEGGPDNCNGQGNDGAACVSDDIVCDETDVDGDGECNTSACDTADGFSEKDEPDNIGGPCGDQTDDQCNNPDTCNAGGTCDDNFEPTTTECTDGDACTSTGGIEGGPDNCNGQGNDGAACVSDDIVCDETDVDDGECNTSACDTADGFCKDEPDNIGGPCGDQTDDQCNNPDTCNAGGTCDDNFEPTTTECTDGDACTSTGGIEGGPDNCNGQGNDGAACVSDDIVCDETDVDGDGECNTSACDTADGFCKDEPDNIGGPCGDQTDDQCNNPDTCNAGGTCDDNFEPTTTECTDGDACTSTGGIEGGPDNCNGQGNDGAACVSDDIVCDETDVDGDGECNTSACDTADGFCKDEPDNIGGPCGDQTDDQCNNPDTCNAGGTCDDNFEPTETTCEDGLFCTSTSGTPGDPDNCNGQGNDGAACVGNPVNCNDGFFCTGVETCDETNNLCVSSGDPCPGTECNTCQEDEDNCFDPSGTSCTDDGLFCTGDEACDGLGSCESSGDPCSGEECNTCQEDEDNCFDPSGTSCTDDGLFCTGDEACDGLGSCESSGDPCSGEECNTCQEDEDNCFDPVDTPCGDFISDTVCTDPDTCDGAGVCLPNNVPCAFVTNSALCSFDTSPKGGQFPFDCDNASGDTSNCADVERQFNANFSPDVQIFPAYKQNSTNPGQYYYNAIYDGTMDYVTLRIPYPFVTQGARPVHLYNAHSDFLNYYLDDNGVECFLPPEDGEGVLAALDYTFGIEDYFDADGAEHPNVVCEYVCGPDGAGFCDVTIPIGAIVDDAGGAIDEVYVNIHLDYGFKGSDLDVNPCDDDTIDRYEPWAPSEWGSSDAYVDTTDNVPVVLAIDDCQDYVFSHSESGDGSYSAPLYTDKVQNLNLFKQIAGIFGRCELGNGDPCGPDLTVALKDDESVVVTTGTTDVDGFYVLLHKHKGKPTWYTVEFNAPDPCWVIDGEVELQGNGWAEMNFFVVDDGDLTPDDCTYTLEYGKGRRKGK